MSVKNIEHPKNLITALIFLGLAWIILQFLHSSQNEQLENRADKAGETC